MSKMTMRRLLITIVVGYINKILLIISKLDNFVSVGKTQNEEDLIA